MGKDDTWAQNAANQLGCTLVQMPVVYLGVPLGANMQKAFSWQRIIKKIRKRLSSWKSSRLPRAGRVALIKIVLNSLPIY